MNSTIVEHRVTAVVEQDRTITVPAVPFEAGQYVEVIVHQLPSITAQLRYPLRGTTVTYDRPFEPIAQDEWEALVQFGGKI